MPSLELIAAQNKLAAARQLVADMRKFRGVGSVNYEYAVNEVVKWERIVNTLTALETASEDK